VQHKDYDELAARLDARARNGHALPVSQVQVATVALRCASQIEMEPVSWLWSGWLAAGKLHMLGGVPGTGKTTIALALAARVTRGGHWPDGTPFKATGNVVIWSGEDDAADTLVPRLVAMGANLDCIHIVSGITDPDGQRPFDPAVDMAALITKAREVGDVRLLIVDPVVSSIAGDSHKNAEVRRGLAPLVAFGESLRAAVIGVTHFSKGTQGRDPLDRLTGSLAFGAAPRLVFAASRKVAEDGEEECRVLVRVKSNIGPDGGAITYSLEQADLPQGIATSRVRWGGTIQGTARDILADAEQTDVEADEESALREAVECLREILADGGPHEASEVTREAKSAGHAERTIRRAREAMAIRPERDGKTRKWYWRLDEQGVQTYRTKKHGHLGHLASSHTTAMPSGGTNGQDVQDAHDPVFGNSRHLAQSEVF
jgi:putative DNA primase/helicase